MKTTLAFFVAAASVFVFTQTAEAHWGCRQTMSYYAPTTAYYAPTTAYYAPSAAYYPSSAFYAPTTAYYGGGYYGGGLFGTGVGGWAGVRGINRRWDRRGW